MSVNSQCSQAKCRKKFKNLSKRKSHKHRHSKSHSKLKRTWCARERIRLKSVHKNINVCSCAYIPKNTSRINRLENV